jgi:anti-sigma regulatory factor (Ser/Thr protein kinase)
MTAHGAPEAVFDPAVGRAAPYEGIASYAPVGLLPDPTPPGAGMGARARICDEAACALRGRPESVKLARDFARETLAAWSVDGLCDDVARVISELVTNALNHGLESGSRARWARPIRVCLTVQPSHVLCTVSDPGGGAPVKKEPDHLGECGRGLQVVECCSDRWGWSPLAGGGKIIWAAFRIPG